jgi:hypothetical protein
MKIFHGIGGYTETGDAPCLVVDVHDGIVKITEHEVDDESNFGHTTHQAHMDYGPGGREVNNPMEGFGFSSSIRHATQKELDRLSDQTLQAVAEYRGYLDTPEGSEYVRGRAP